MWRRCALSHWFSLSRQLIWLNWTDGLLEGGLEYLTRKILISDKICITKGDWRTRAEIVSVCPSLNLFYWRTKTCILERMSVIADAVYGTSVVVCVCVSCPYASVNREYQMFDRVRSLATVRSVIISFSRGNAVDVERCIARKQFSICSVEKILFLHFCLIYAWWCVVCFKSTPSSSSIGHSKFIGWNKIATFAANHFIFRMLLIIIVWTHCLLSVKVNMCSEYDTYWIHLLRWLLFRLYKYSCCEIGVPTTLRMKKWTLICCYSSRDKSL